MSVRQPARRMRRAHSAGGVVFRRPQPDTPGAAVQILLLQHEAGKWMLPKGTIEAGETPEAVALREVAEETGLRNVRIVQDLGEERYLFFWKTEDTYYDKTVHYYLMEFLGGEETRPQREEGFIRCDWVAVSEALERIRYKETREVVRRAAAALAAAASRESSAAPEVRHGSASP